MKRTNPPISADRNQRPEEPRRPAWGHCPSKSLQRRTQHHPRRTVRQKSGSGTVRLGPRGPDSATLLKSVL
ncbi:hypothetical protein SKAU_G00310610 [Synaphobranchus kaupii]|uniref:Uncharacterized protein n=1 Tax=Synaphobranchus kaupii TaxID=118154 RepID=A0A9Q1ERQ3_SYNKA|nr:hypothetical protein SKAU_G00310610 [Synaphobranchus kaupii]